MPTATDLVTDLPADFEVFGQAVATSMADLLGGTSGQILAKNSNTDMDFVWVTNDVGDITAVTAGTGISGGGTSGAVTITNSMATEITAKADLIVGTGNATFDNLPVGTNGQVLTADSTVSPTGLKWATPASGSTFVGCSVYKVTTDQTLSNDTDTVITFNAEEFDTNAFHDNSTNNSRITIPAGKGGKYLIISTISFAANSTGIRSIYFKLNNTTNIILSTQYATTSSSTYRGTASGIYDLTAGDYIECIAAQNSGGNLNVNATQSQTRFGVVYLGA